MKRCCIFTLASKRFMPMYQQLHNSIMKYYPDIPHILIGQDQLDAHHMIEPGPTSLNWYSTFGKELAKEYELVIQMDADSIMTAPMPHVFERPYEVASVRNNNPVGFKTVYGNIGFFKYLNIGFIAIRGERFWNEWHERSLHEATQLPYREQDLFNIMFYSGRYMNSVLDDHESESYYGCSSYGEYKSMYMNDGYICLHNKVVRVMHTAGNPDLKMWFGDCPTDVRDYITSLVTPEIK